MGILVLMILFFAGFPMVCAMMAVAYDIKNPTPKGYYTVNDEGKIVRNPELEEEETKKVLIPDNIKKRGQTRSTQRMDAKVTEVRVKDNTVKKIVLENGKIVYQSEEEKSEKTSLYTIMSSLDEESNFLKTEFIVHVKDVEELKETAELIQKIDKVSEVKYEESVVKRMVPVFDVVSKVTIVIIVGLVCVTVFLICNTIKLTIFARKSEIEIMRLVGTSNFVIKLPFVIEGLFLGIIGSIIPIAATIWGYTIAYDKLNGHLFTNFITMLKPLPFTVKISGILVLIGAVVGMFGSYRTVRRYLKI